MSPNGNVRLMLRCSQIWGLYRPECTSMFAFIYAILVNLMWVTLYANYGMYEIFQKMNAANNFFKIAGLSLAAAKAFTNLFTLLSTHVSMKAFRAILKRLHDLDEEMKIAFGVQPDLQRGNTKLQLAVIAYVSSEWIVYSMKLYFGPRLYEPVIRLQPHHITYPLLSSLSLVIVGQFLLLAYGFERRFRTINDFLQGLRGKAAFNWENVNKAHAFHAECRDILDDVTRHFSFRLLAFVIALFLTTFVNLTVRFLSMFFNTELRWEVSPVLTDVHTFFKLSSVAVFIHILRKTPSQADKTVKILYKLIKSNEDNYEMGHEITRMFHLDLWHHKVKFNIFNFVTLDNTILATITASAITYALFLSQFETIYLYLPSQDEKNEIYALIKKTPIPQ